MVSYNLQKTKIHISFLANSNPSRHDFKKSKSIQFIAPMFVLGTGTSTSSRLRSSFRREESLGTPPNDWWFGWMFFLQVPSGPPPLRFLFFGWCTVPLNNDPKPLIVDIYPPGKMCVQMTMFGNMFGACYVKSQLRI